MEIVKAKVAEVVALAQTKWAGLSTQNKLIVGAVVLVLLAVL